jgi:hypothetical protein
MVREYFLIEQVTFSPLSWLRGYVSSQVWFICRPLPSLSCNGS